MARGLKTHTRTEPAPRRSCLSVGRVRVYPQASDAQGTAQYLCVLKPQARSQEADSSLGQDQQSAVAWSRAKTRMETKVRKHSGPSF